MRLSFAFFLLAIVTGFTASIAYSQSSKKNGSLYPSASYSGKAIIDDAAIQHWEVISNDKPVASNDGKYFAYTMNRANLPKIVILQSIQDKWNINLGDVTLIGFSKSNRFFIYRNTDSLCLFDLNQRQLFRVITGIKSSKLPDFKQSLSWLHSENQEHEWIGWQLKNNTSLYLLNLSTGKDRHYPQISNYLFSQQGTVLVLQSTDNIVKWIDLSSNQAFTVWKADTTRGLYLGAMAIDRVGKKLAFIVQAKSNKKNDLAYISNSIWLYEHDMRRIEEKANNESNGLDNGLLITNNISFNIDDRYLVFSLRKTSEPRQSSNNIKVDIWNYKDTFLQSVQLHSNTDGKFERITYTGSINIENDKIVLLQYNVGDRIKSLSTRDYAIVSTNFVGSRFWLSQKDSNWLLSCKDGSRKFLQVGNNLGYYFSPSGKFLLYYDGDLHHYFSRELATGKITNLTISLPPLTMAPKVGGGTDYYYAFQQPGKRKTGNWITDIAGWIEDSDKVIVYDDHDLWQLDLSGQESPKNLTGGYGVKHNIRFRLAVDPGTHLTIAPKVPLLLVALDLVTKENGFYQVTINKSGLPIKLTMGPYTYYHSPDAVFLSISIDAGIAPVRSGSRNSWIVKRQSDREAPNYYLTHDFKNFISLTDYAPQKTYNWPQAEVITWVRPDGDINQGVLYKPTNLDQNQKYPVIFNIYSQQSGGAYRYLLPEYSNCPVFNIPYMVSRGYLVFIPDMHYMIGAHGKSGLVSVESGVKALARLPYVDTSKMALTGHSFSGQTAFYIAANSHLFKAIVAGAGWTDMISSYLQLSGSAGVIKTRSFMDFLEPNFNNFTIWERPDIYQAESPVLRADSVQTPLLIFHNQGDTKPIEQALEMYLALYRLQKPVWMLQYDEAGHVVFGSQAVDFTIRMTQFFDHYLKGLPAPRWMTRGIRASQKGIDDGYRLDTLYKCGIYCPICNK